MLSLYAAIPHDFRTNLELVIIQEKVETHNVYIRVVSHYDFKLDIKALELSC